MANEISIQEFMAIISDDERMGETFTLRVVRATGTRKGSIATIAKCRYGSPAGQRESTASTAVPSSNEEAANTPRWLHKEKGTLPMTDTEKKKYFTPLISHIIGYNQYQVRH